MRKILKQCLRLAIQKNNPVNHPQWDCFHHFSFVIQANKIIEYGFNRAGAPHGGFGYPEYGKIHSENDAYRKAKGLLDHQKPFEMVNIRLNKKDELRSSRPCPCCFNFLEAIGCRTVYHSTDVGFVKIVLQ